MGFKNDLKKFGKKVENTAKKFGKQVENEAHRVKEKLSNHSDAKSENLNNISPSVKNSLHGDFLQKIGVGLASEAFNATGIQQHILSNVASDIFLQASYAKSNAQYDIDSAVYILEYHIMDAIDPSSKLILQQYLAQLEDYIETIETVSPTEVVIENAKDTASNAADKVKEAASDASDKAEEMVDSAKDTASNAVDKVKETASDASDKAEEMVDSAKESVEQHEEDEHLLINTTGADAEEPSINQPVTLGDDISHDVSDNELTFNEDDTVINLD